MRPRIKSTTQFTIGFALCMRSYPPALPLATRRECLHPVCPPGVAMQIHDQTLNHPASIHWKQSNRRRLLLLPQSSCGNDLCSRTPPACSAIKEFQRSEKAVHSGDFQSAAEHLRKAIQIDPNFVQAHNNLGASYIELNECESAVTEFRKAIDLDSKLQESYRNLGLALFLLRRYPEAEIAARQALQLGPQRGSARYTLVGFSLPRAAARLKPKSCCANPSPRMSTQDCPWRRSC